MQSLKCTRALARPIALAVAALAVALAAWLAAAPAPAWADATYTWSGEDGTLTEEEEGVITLSGDGTFALTADTTATVEVSSGTVVIELAGCTLTQGSASSSAAPYMSTVYIASGATVTIQDSSSAGTGTIQNTANASANTGGSGAVFNNGTCTIASGIYQAVSEAGTAWYTIVNHGTMEITGGTFTNEEAVSSSGSSLIENGYYSYSSGNALTGYVEGTNAAEPTLTIAGGTFTSEGGAVVKNDDAGVLTISGGTFTAEEGAGTVVQNWNTATISGGTFTSATEGASVVCNGGYGADSVDAGQMTITGGTFTAYTSSDGETSGTLFDSIAGTTYASESTLSVSGGTFEGDLDAKIDEFTLTVSGGTFSDAEDVEGYLVEGAEVDEDGTVTAYVASVTSSGTTTKYTSLADAVSAAAAGDTLTLLADVTWSESASYINITVSITIDMDGHTLEIASTGYTCGFYLYNADVTIKDGTVLDSRCASRSYSADLQTFYVLYGDLTLDGVTVKLYRPSSSSLANYAVYVINGNETVTLSGSSIVELENSVSRAGFTYGIYYWGYYSAYTSIPESGAVTGTINVTDSTIRVYGHAICGNGAYHNTEITITDSTLVSTGSTAIFHPQYGTITINESDEGTTYIEGVDAGIEIRAGHLIVNGGTIVCTSESFALNTEAPGSGNTVTGSAIAISQHSTNIPTSVTINGGTLSGYYAIYEVDLIDTTTDDISISITGGTLTSTASDEDVSAVYSENCTGFVSGGVFSSAVDEAYCAEGYAPLTVVDEDGTTFYTVAEDVTGEEDAGSVAAWGGSLRTDYTDDEGNTIYTTASLRLGFCWDDLPDGAELVEFGWWYGTSSDAVDAGTASTVVGENYRQAGSYSYDQATSGYVANLVVTGIGAAYYDSPIYAKMYVTYELDGAYYTITSPTLGRDVLYVAESIESAYADVDSSSLSETEQEELAYAEGIVSAAQDTLGSSYSCSHSYTESSTGSADDESGSGSEGEASETSGTDGSGSEEA